MACQDPVRRSLLLTALAAGACLAAKPVAAEEDQPGSDERPQKGDFLVHSEGEHAGEIINPSDLKLGGPPGARLAEGPEILGDPQRIAAQRDCPAKA